MTMIKNIKSPFDLTDPKYLTIKEKIISKLKDKVIEAYLFGSFAHGTHQKDSDIDLVIICETSKKFHRRIADFSFLLDLFPRMDILVYTPSEFSEMKEDNNPTSKNFYKSLIKII